MTPSFQKIDAGLWACLAAAVVFGAVLVAPAVLSASGDVYWHIAAGRWMLENQAFLTIDPFSAVFGGHAWETRDWLGEVLLALAYIGAGWSGILALTAAVAAGSAGLLAFHLFRNRPDAVTAVWLMLALVCGTAAVAPMPYLLSLPCLIVWTAGLVRGDGKPPPLTLLPVMAVWANLSGSFVTGLILVLVLAAEAVSMAAGNRLKMLRGWSVFAGYSLVLALLTPTGVPGLAHAIAALVPSGPAVTLLPLLLALPAAAVLLPRRAMWFRAVFLAGLFVLALHGAVGQLFFAATAPLVMIGRATQQGQVLPPRPRPLIALAVIAVVAIVMRLVWPVVRTDDVWSPQTALETVPEMLRQQAVFNDPAFGGFLIHNGIKPFIDTRPHYSAGFRGRYAHIAEPDVLKNALSHYRIGWTLLEPASPAVKIMDGLGGWKRLYQDQWAVVYVRRSAP